MIIIFGGLCAFLFFVQLQLAANIDFGTGATADAYGDIIDNAPSFFGGGFGLIATISDNSTAESNTTVFTEPGFFDSACLLAQKLHGIPDIVNECVLCFCSLTWISQWPRLLTPTRLSCRSISNVAYQQFIQQDSCITATVARDMVMNPTALNKGAYYRWACGEGQHLLNLTTFRSSTTSFSPSFNPFSSRSKVRLLRAQNVHGVHTPHHNVCPCST